MTSLNKYYRDFPTLQGDDLPYKFEIGPSMKVYYRTKNGDLRKADSIFMKNIKWLVISIENVTITVKGFINKKWIYEVKNNNLEVADV